MSKKSKITKTIDYLSKPRHGITAAVLLVLAIIVVVYITRKVKGLWNKTGTFSNAVTMLGDEAIESGTGTSITSSIDFAHLWARLFDAMVWLGTDEEEVYSVLGMLNTQADYMKLCRVWAEKWATLGFLISKNVQPTLPGELRSELTSSELAKARSILLSNGITPDF